MYRTKQHDQGPAAADGQHGGRKPLPPQHTAAEGGDIPVQGVEPDDPLHPDAHLGGVVEDGAAVHKGGAEHLPHMHHVPEKDVGGGQDQPHPQAEEEEGDDGVDKEDEGPFHPGAGKDHDQHQRHKGEQAVHQPEAAFFQGEDIFGDIHLAQQGGVFQNALHGHGGGVPEEVEEQLPEEQKDGEIFDAVAPGIEDAGKDGPHHQAHHQGVEHAPGHAQYAAAVLELEIPADEVLQKIPVAPEILAIEFQRRHGGFTTFQNTQTPARQRECAFYPFRSAARLRRTRATGCPRWGHRRGCRPRRWASKCRCTYR